MAKEVNKEKKQEKKVKNEKDKKSFAKDFKAELKKVSWPTPKQLVNNTAIVIVIVLITAAIVFVLDVVFESLNNYGIEKLKAMVTSNTSENVDNSTDGATVVDNSNTTNTENTSVEAGTENTVANESVEQTNTTGEEVVSEQ
ncbi:MAG: preprotein translocase subunit SecE [Clostridia bacterium]|nr:preprotein translocase subunit SecE [Clostridia bacterium]